jgi:pimeloyl-ACP methyl ester carboxylesterase
MIWTLSVDGWRAEKNDAVWLSRRANATAFWISGFREGDPPRSEQLQRRRQSPVSVAKSVGVQELIVRAIFPWCFTPELYAERPDYIESLAAFVRSRPAQSVPDSILQSNAVLGHSVEAHLGRITAPTQITFGRHDQLTSSVSRID